MTLHDDRPTRERTERLAYHLWQEAGCPEGHSDRFWREAEALIAAEEAPRGAPPAESLPMSDPVPQAVPVESGWGAAAARYFAAWWAYPSKPADR